MLLTNQGAGEQKRVMHHEMSCNSFMPRCKEFIYFTNFTEFKYCLYLTHVQYKLNTSPKCISHFNFLQL